MDEDDDTQTYKDDGNALLIAYQSGYYDGKKAAQPAQEPVGEVNRHGRDSHGRQWHGIHWYDANVDVPHGTKLYTAPPKRPLVDLTDADWKEIEDMPDVFDQGVAWCLARLKEKNT
jgi:hypothetical protein